MGLKNHKIIFLPNGYGDLLMFFPTIVRMISCNITLSFVVASNSHKSLLLNYFPMVQHVYVRYNNSKVISHLTLFLRLYFSNGTIIAPLVSCKYINYLFLRFVRKDVFLPKTFCYVTKRFKHVDFDLNTYHGHQINYYINFVYRAGVCIPYNDVPVNFYARYFNKSREKIKTEFKQPIVAVGISTGPKESHKIPSLNWFVELMLEIYRIKSVSFFMFGIKSDVEKIKYIIKMLPHLNIAYAVDSPFSDVIKSLQKCDVGVTGTTGQGHMMAFAGLPLVVLCGVTDAYESGPYAERCIIHEHDLSCSPCYSADTLYGCDHNDCMNMISPNYVAQSIIKILCNDQIGSNWLDVRKKKFPIPLKSIMR